MTPLGLAMTVLLAGAATTSDWPALRGPNHDGSAPPGARFAAGEGALRLRWKATLGAGYSGLAVAGGRAVTLFSDGGQDVVAALDAETGKEAWRHALGPAHPGRDGSYDGPIATPALAEGRAFALGPRGHLVAVELATGRLLWRKDLAQGEKTKAPHYGIGTSPLVAGGVLVVETGAEGGAAIAGFDPATGRKLWSLGQDVVQYQSPVAVSLGGREVVVAVGDAKLFVIDPASGRLLAEHAHGGENHPIAVASAVPVPAGDGRVFVKTHSDQSTMLRLAARPDGTVAVETLWRAPVLRATYSPAVYHEGHLYGMNGRTVLSCVDAATGELRWRSREPGDGFLAVVDGDLVVLTKDRTLHVGPASPEGWREKARIELFEDVAWTPPSFAGGSVFARGHREVARVDWSPAAVKAAGGEDVLSPRFARFLAEVETAPDKKATVDRFLDGLPGGPLLEWPDRVVFLYRGEAADMGIVTDLFGGMRREDPMHRVPGTDLFYYESRVDPDVRVNYHFVRNFEQPLPDPRNPRQVPALFGKVPASSLAMPAWREPEHLQPLPEAAPRGSLEAAEVAASSPSGAKVPLQVYLPAGFPAEGRRYPVAYVLDGARAREQGLLPHSLDRLMPGRVAPAIVVLMGPVHWGASPPPADDHPAALLALLLRDVVPFVDGRYPTLARPEGRAVVGHEWSGLDAVRAALASPPAFGGLALQSLLMLTSHEDDLRAVLEKAAPRPLRVYQDWGRYDVHGTRENWDMREANRRFQQLLRDKGYRPAGGEAPDGAGWASYRNRTDRVFETLFPAP